MNKLCNSIVSWLQEYAQQAGADGAVFGMSGGVDSAVVSVLCKKAFKENVLGLIMPCYSDEEDEKDARLVADKFNIKYHTVVLDRIYDEFLKRFTERVKALKMGDPFDPETQIGPLAREDLAIDLEKQVNESIAMGAQ